MEESIIKSDSHIEGISILHMIYGRVWDLKR